jgi:hypothetical protein
MFESVCGSEVLSHMPVSEWFEGFCKGCVTLKMIQGMGMLQLPKMHKHLQMFVNWWQETVKCF